MASPIGTQRLETGDLKLLCSVHGARGEGSFGGDAGSQSDAPGGGAQESRSG